MQIVHNQKMSQWLAVLVTIILEVLFAFLGGWTLYDVFISWGQVAAIIVGSLSGIVFLFLSLYVFIFREYAIDAVKIFAAKRNEDAAARLGWGLFLVVVCVLMDSAFNADRMVGLSISDPWAKFFIWVGLQCMVFVPFALGKMVHAHVNVVDHAAHKSAARQARMVSLIDESLYGALEQVLPSLNAHELLQLKSGNMQVLQDRLNALEAERRAIQAPKQLSPLEEALTQYMTNQGAGDATRNTAPFRAAPSGNGNGAHPGEN